MRSDKEITENIRFVGMCKDKLLEANGINSGTLNLPYCKLCSVVWGRNEEGWEHVSVAPKNKRLMPTWDDMCILKDMFWHTDEEVHQIHPKGQEYVNIVDNCLHLWRPVEGWKHEQNK